MLLKAIIIAIAIWVIPRIGLTQELPVRRPQQIYFELLGNGFLYSINYQHVLYRNFDYRVGLTFIPGNQLGPGLVSEMIYRPGKRKRFEFGGGFTFLYRIGTDIFPDQGPEAFYTMRFGYQLSQDEGRWVTKISIIDFTALHRPLNISDNFPSIGFSIGRKIRTYVPE